MMDFSKVLIRCSGLHNIMTNLSSPDLTQGHLTYTKKLYRELKWKRHAQIKSKYLDKGILMEEDAITLLARVKGIMLNKNEERITNSFLTGHPDIYIGGSIRKATKGYDTKCSWSADTFPFPEDKLDPAYEFQDHGYMALTGAQSWVTDKLDPAYEFQDHGYMALTGAQSWVTAFCLVNAPGHQVLGEKYSLMRRLNVSETDPVYIKGCCEIERNMIFDMGQFMKHNPHFDIHSTVWDYDIPMKERVVEFEVQRDDNMIDRIYNRVKQVRLNLAEIAGRSISAKDFTALEVLS